jgi:hypothetical protein
MAQSIKRKIIAAFLVLAMVIGMIPAATLTANAESISSNTIVNFNTAGASWNTLPTCTDLGSSTFSDNEFTFKYDDGHNTNIWGASGSGAGSSGSPAITLNGGSDQVETLTITNGSGKSFKFSGFYIEGMGYGHGNWQIEGFRDGISCGSQTIDTSFITKNVSLDSNTNLQNVDKIVISSTSAGYNGVCLDDFVFDPAVTAPVLSAQSASEVAETGADINFTSDKAGAYYYLIYAAKDAAPDADTVKAQGDAVSKGSGAALAAANKVSVNSLSAATSYKAYVIVEDSSNNKSEVSAIDIATKAAETYAISLVTVENFKFPVATVGYGAQSFYSVRVDSTGTGATGALTVKLSGKNPEAFALSTDSISSIASGGNYSFKVNPVTGLSAGDYTATVTVSGDKVASKSFNVSFTVNPAGTTFTATVYTYADGVAKDVTGDVELYNGTSGTTASKSGTGIYSATVASGDYWIYINGKNTGRTLTIGTSDNSKSMEYYTVSFSTSYSGTATGSSVGATCEGSTISSGTLVLKGSRVAITAMGTGAGSYSYLWSGTGTSGQTTAQIAISSLSGTIDAACAVTGTGAPSADPDYEINGVSYTWTGSAETIALTGASDSLTILKAPSAAVNIEVQSDDGSKVEINGSSAVCVNTRIIVFNNITLTVNNLNITAPLNWPALQLNSDGRVGTMILNVKGDCSFTGTGYACGVISDHDQDVVITGDGTLNATGGGNVSDIDGGTGILVTSYLREGSLTIEGNITLNATGGTSLTNSGGTGISVASGNLLIKSGVVKATSGISYGDISNSSFGIMASFSSNTHSSGGNITIEGGNVTATGGDADKVSGGYGIYAFNKLSIKGGIVKAVGGNSKTAVGGAAVLAYEQNLEVSGGSLEAIGGKSESNYGGQAIYNFYKDIVISGGTVTATGGNSTNKDGGRGIVVAGSGNLLINGGDVTAKGGNGGGYGAHAIYVNLGTAMVNNGANLSAVGGNGATAGGGVGLRAAGYDGATLHGNIVTIANDAGKVYIRGGQGAAGRRASIMGKDIYIETGNIGSIVMEGTNSPRSIKNTPGGDDIYLLAVSAGTAEDVCISSYVTGTKAGSYTYRAPVKAEEGLAYMWLPSGSQTVTATGYRSSTVSLPEDSTANNSITISKKSNDAALTELLTKLDTTPGSQTGSDSSDAIAWEVSVSNSISELSPSDIAVTSGAAVKLYSNPEFTAEVTDPDTLPLAAGSITKAYIRVTSEDGLNTKYYAVAITRAASGDASLTSVFGQAITVGAEAGTKLAPKTAAINVAHNVTEIAAEDIVKGDAGATTTFYGTDSSFTTPAASGVNLTAGSGTEVYIKVAAADGTQLYYKVTVNRQYVSGDASLTSILGHVITAGAEAGTKLAPKTAVINVANTVTKIAAEDIVKGDAGATTTFYGTDSTFTTPSAISLDLSAGSGTVVYIKATAADGTQLYYKITVNRASASSSGGQGGSTKQPVQTQPSDTGVEILVNGKTETAAKATTTQVGVQMVTTIIVDDKKVEEKLQKEGNNATVTIPVKKAADVVVGQLNGQTVKNMENKEAVLEIKTENVTYTLPAAQINIDAISAQIGRKVELSDIKVNVAISAPPQDAIKIIGDTANKNNYVVVAKPVEFNITCTSGDKTIEVTKFNSYVQRLVAIPEGIDPSKITTGIVLNSDGTFSHVPTEITIIGGKYYARINSLTNSTYSVVYSPKTFKDVEKHWAKNAVNDMGSRLVISGVGNNMFEPDVDITRAEFAAIVVKALGLMRPGTGKASFNDISKKDWYYDAVSIAYEHGILSGYDDGNFGPDDKITREQAMTIIAKATIITGLNPDIKSSEVSELLSKYTDGKAASDYAKTSIATCLKTGIITGRSSTAIAPKNYITRAEVASIVQKLLKKSNLI